MGTESIILKNNCKRSCGWYGDLEFIGYTSSEKRRILERLK